jgi:hypothetical protein
MGFGFLIGGRQTGGQQFPQSEGRAAPARFSFAV